MKFWAGGGLRARSFMGCDELRKASGIVVFPVIGFVYGWR